MERDIQILEHKIAECDRLLVNFDRYNIAQRKIDKITAKKNAYQVQLDELLS